MQVDLQSRIQQYLNRNRRQKKWIVLSLLLSFCVALGTFRTMLIPAVTMHSPTFTVTAEAFTAKPGVNIPVKVSASIPAAGRKSHFTLYSTTTGGGLSDVYQFEDEVAMIPTDDGKKLPLHREIVDNEGTIIYWFELDVNEAVSFTLNCTSDMALYNQLPVEETTMPVKEESITEQATTAQANEDATEAVKEEIITENVTEGQVNEEVTEPVNQEAFTEETTTEAVNEPTAAAPEPAPTLPNKQSPVTESEETPAVPDKDESDKEKEQTFKISFSAADSKDEADALAKSEFNHDVVGFTWSETITLTAVTESGLGVEMKGPSSAFEKMNGSLLFLSVEELPDEADGQPTEAMKLLGGQVETLDTSDVHLLDIRLLLDGEEVQPDGNVTVTFLGLSEVTGEEKVFHVDETAQTVTDMQAKATEDKALVMETEHFSTYALLIPTDALIGPPYEPNAYFENNMYAVPNIDDTFGEARKFNVFCLNDFHTGPDVEGTVAVGGTLDSSGLPAKQDFTISGYSKSPVGNQDLIVDPCALVVGKGINTSGNKVNVSVYSGHYANEVWLNAELANNWDTVKTLITDLDDNDNSKSRVSGFTYIDQYFANIGNGLKDNNKGLFNGTQIPSTASTYTIQDKDIKPLSEEVTKGVADKDGNKINGSLTFKGEDPYINVFNVTFEQLKNAAYEWVFDVPSTSNVLINIKDTESKVDGEGKRIADFCKPLYIRIKSLPDPTEKSQAAWVKYYSTPAYVNFARKTLWNFDPDVAIVNMPFFYSTEIAQSNEYQHCLPGSVFAPHAKFNIVTQESGPGGDGLFTGFNGNTVVDSLFVEAGTKWEGHLFPPSQFTPNPTKFTATVKKKWAGEEGLPFTPDHPDVKVQLLCKPIGDKDAQFQPYPLDEEEKFEAVLNEANNWTHAWTGLPLNFEYRTKEVTVLRDYTSTEVDVGFDTVITNTYIPRKYGVDIKKTDSDGKPLSGAVFDLWKTAEPVSMGEPPVWKPGEYPKGALVTWKDAYYQATDVIYNNPETNTEPGIFPAWKRVSLDPGVPEEPSDTPPEWNEGTKYYAGMLVSCGEKIYRAKYADPGNPSTNADGWTDVTPEPEEPDDPNATPKWNATTKYKPDDIVRFTLNGTESEFEAIVWNLGVPPDDTTLDKIWRKVAESSKDPTEDHVWDVNKVYKRGEVVEYTSAGETKTYTATEWNLGVKPNESSLWQLNATILNWQQQWYAVGSKVTYNGDIYEANEGNSFKPGLWELITDDQNHGSYTAGSPPAYNMGDLVTYNGNIYKATEAVTGWNNHPEVWSKITIETIEPDPLDTPPAWDESKAYVIGTLVSYDGTTYRAESNTTGEIPGIGSSWKSIESGGETETKPPLWNSINLYLKGMLVTYNDKIYVATDRIEPNTDVKPDTLTNWNLVDDSETDPGESETPVVDENGFEQWTESKWYSPNFKVYEGEGTNKKCYVANVWNTNLKPSDDPNHNIWTEYTEGSTSSNVWNVNKVYKPGDKVTYKGVEYIAKIWSMGVQPETWETPLWKTASATPPAGTEFIPGTSIPGTKIEPDLTSGADGMIHLSELDPGTYFLFEKTPPPDGYYAPEDPFIFEITEVQIEEPVKDENGNPVKDEAGNPVVKKVIHAVLNITQDNNGLAKIWNDPEPQLLEDDEEQKNIHLGTIAIVNNKRVTLPDTGGVGTTTYTLAGILLLALACLMYRKNRIQGGGRNLS